MIGITLIRSFSKENHQLVAIDLDAKNVDTVVNKYDVKGLVGSGCERRVLMDAEVDKADYFIACTSRDELNIISCTLAKKLGAKHVIARVRDPEYFSEMDNIKDVLGLDLVFNPEYRTAVEIAQILKFPSANSVETFTSTDVKMVEFDITDGNPIIGKTIMEIIRGYQCKLLFAVIKRGEEIFIPRGDFVIEEGDVAHIFASESEIVSFCKKLNIFKPRARSVFIVGGGKIAYYLAEILVESGVSVNIVEKDQARCRELSIDLPPVNVLCGDGTDQNLLREENLESTDACVTLTGIDEKNVIISLYAKGRNISKVITKVERHSIINMVDRLGLDTVLCPRDIIANHLIRFVRAHKGDADAGINTYYKIHDAVEILEFEVGKNFPALNTPIKDLKFIQGVLIAGVIRNGTFILPQGETCFKESDKVLVVAGISQITELSQIIKGIVTE